MPAIRCHRYFPQIKIGTFILVYEDETDAAERRRQIVNRFFDATDLSETPKEG